VFTGYVAAGTTGSGANYALEAIATCVIAGTSLMGGEIIDTLVGLLIIASLQNGMSVMNMPIFSQFIIRGDGARPGGICRCPVQKKEPKEVNYVL
jgi:D-xylose transport system permease protein